MTVAQWGPVRQRRGWAEGAAGWATPCPCPCWHQLPHFLPQPGPALPALPRQQLGDVAPALQAERALAVQMMWLRKGFA